MDKNTSLDTASFTNPAASKTLSTLKAPLAKNAMHF